MNLNLSEEQQLLRASAVDYLRNNYDPRLRLETLARGEVMLPGVWRQWAELGWLGLPFAEEDGGLALGPVELMLFCEEFGRHLVIEPYLETIVLAGGLLRRAGSPAQRARWLAPMIAGEVQAAFAHGEPQHAGWTGTLEARVERHAGAWRLRGAKSVVYNAPQADLLFVLAGGGDGQSVVMVKADAANLRRRDYRTVDGRCASDIEFDGVLLADDDFVGAPGQAGSVVEAVFDEARLAAAAEALGAMSVLLDTTVEYTKQRKQFGVAISTFQSLQHKMADMYIAIELLRSLLNATAIKQRDGAPDAARFTAALKAKADTAARAVAHNAMQLHGAIATTNELSVGHHLKRLLALAQRFGNARHHTARFAAMGEAGRSAVAA